MSVALQADRIISIEDGRIVSDERIVRVENECCKTHYSSRFKKNITRTLVTIIGVILSLSR